MILGKLGLQKELVNPQFWSILHDPSVNEKTPPTKLIGDINCLLPVESLQNEYSFSVEPLDKVVVFDNFLTVGANTEGQYDYFKTKDALIIMSKVNEMPANLKIELLRSYVDGADITAIAQILNRQTKSFYFVLLSNKGMVVGNRSTRSSKLFPLEFFGEKNSNCVYFTNCFSNYYYNTNAKLTDDNINRVVITSNSVHEIAYNDENNFDWQVYSENNYLRSILIKPPL